LGVGADVDEREAHPGPFRHVVRHGRIEDLAVEGVEPVRVAGEHRDVVDPIEQHHSMVPRPPTPLQQAIEETLRDLRPGEGVRYGFVAGQAGYPGRARAVGTFLATHHDAPNWWRVVAANGHLRAPRPELQAQLLAAEGVDVIDGRVSRRPPR